MRPLKDFGGSPSDRQGPNVGQSITEHVRYIFHKGNDHAKHGKKQTRPETVWTVCQHVSDRAPGPSGRRLIDGGLGVRKESGIDNGTPDGDNTKGGQGGKTFQADRWQTVQCAQNGRSPQTQFQTRRSHGPRQQSSSGKQQVELS